MIFLLHSRLGYILNILLYFLLKCQFGFSGGVEGRNLMFWDSLNLFFLWHKFKYINPLILRVERTQSEKILSISYFQCKSIRFLCISLLRVTQYYFCFYGGIYWIFINLIFFNFLFPFSFTNTQSNIICLFFFSILSFTFLN